MRASTTERSCPLGLWRTSQARRSMANVSAPAICGAAGRSSTPREASASRPVRTRSTRPGRPWRTIPSTACGSTWPRCGRETPRRGRNRGRRFQIDARSPKAPTRPAVAVISAPSRARSASRGSTSGRSRIVRTPRPPATSAATAARPVKGRRYRVATDRSNIASRPALLLPASMAGAFVLIVPTRRGARDFTEST